MEYPLDTARFLDWYDSFQPHLRSIVALRMWEEEDAFLKVTTGIEGRDDACSEGKRTKCSRFSPKEKWAIQDGNMQWIRFCDLRGGHRPSIQIQISIWRGRY